MAIECKWSSSAFAPANLKAFRRQYAKGNNLVVAADVKRPFSQVYGEINVRFVSLEGLIKIVTSSAFSLAP